MAEPPLGAAGSIRERASDDGPRAISAARDIFGHSPLERPPIPTDRGHPATDQVGTIQRLLRTALVSPVKTCRASRSETTATPDETRRVTHSGFRFSVGADPFASPDATVARDRGRCRRAVRTLRGRSPRRHTVALRDVGSRVGWRPDRRRVSQVGHRGPVRG